MVIFLFIMLMSVINHPIPLLLFIIFSTFYLSIFLMFFIKFSWSSMIFTILMIGGLLILFIFMSSVSSNLKFKTSLNKMLLFLFLAINFYFYYNSMNHYFFISEKNLYFWVFSHHFLIMIMILLYMLLSMCIILEMSSPIKTPLRSF